MTNRILAALTLTLILTPIAALATPPTNAQKCTSDVEKASGKFAQCKLNAESSFTKTGDSVKLTAALAKCATTLQTAFGKATTKYLGACPMTEPEAAFDAYLSQCSDDTTAAAGGATLPDYVGELASCNADLTTCNGDLATCNGDLTTCSGDLTTCTTDLTTAEADLATCEGDLAACEALPPARLLKTGQTTCWNAAGSVIACASTGQDGDIQAGATLAYVDNGDGTMTDVNTGLMWEKLDDNNTGGIHDKDNAYSWDNAFAAKVATLNTPSCFAGYCDWRVPNYKELVSILNLENVGPAVSPAFNTACAPGCTATGTPCSCTASSSYWSSTTRVVNPFTAYAVFFSSDSGVGAPGKTDNTGVRAVRGGS